MPQEFLAQILKDDPHFKNSIRDAWGTWEKFFAKQYNVRVTREDFDERLANRSRLQSFTAEELVRMDVDGTLITRELFGKAPQEQRADAPEKHIQSLQNWLDRDEIKTPVILAGIGDKLVMLDGDHRAIAATIKGRAIQALVVPLDVTEEPRH